MHVIHTGTADPDSNQGTVALRDDEVTNGYNIEFDAETGEARFADPIPDTYDELQRLAKAWGIDASQSAEDLRAAIESKEGVPDQIAEQMAEAWSPVEFTEGSG